MWNPERSEASTLRTSRVVRVTPERAFAVWTDPNQIVRWWGPAGVTCPDAHIDLRVGGEYRIANQFADGRVVWIHGRFEAIDAPSSLIYSWHIDGEQHESAGERVTVRFEPRGGGTTEIVVIHERIRDPERRESHTIGWAGCLDGFVALVESPSGSLEELLEQARAIATRYIASLPERFVGARANFADLVERLGGSEPIPDLPQDAHSVIAAMADAVEPGIVATAGPRYFGLVIGGALPATVAADWLTSAWEQNAFSFTTSPAAGAVEEVSRRWLADLLGLARDVSLGLVTGATMANFTCLAAARHATLAALGWDVEERGLTGAPAITVIASDESHATLFAALQMLGLGRRATRVATDDQGRMRSEELRAVVSRTEPPFVVCAQAGNVNTGAFDPLVDVASIVHERRGWLHVDSAFGAWAAASARYRDLAEGIAAADSLSLDAHKWLNVPYDCGFAFTRHPEAHRAAMTLEAPYYASVDAARNNHNFVPESSRRARGFTVYAALRSLGRSGVEQLVDRCCALARRIADRLAASGRARILNDVVLNQLLVQFTSPDGDDDAMTARVIRRVQDDGTCWAGGSSWHGRQVMRISVSNWSTTEADIDRSADAMLRAYDDCIKHGETSV